METRIEFFFVFGSIAVSLGCFGDFLEQSGVDGDRMLSINGASPEVFSGWEGYRSALSDENGENFYVEFGRALSRF